MSKYKVISIFCIFLMVNYNFTPCKGVTQLLARDRLKNHLFVNYNPHVRPGKEEEALQVQIGLDLEHFTFYESNAACDFIGVLKIVWYDPKLKWDPRDYNNLTSINIDRNSVWLPDIELYNNVAHNFFGIHKNGMVLLENTGRLVWMDDIKMQLFCTPSLKNWPNDQHSCKLIFGSWIHHAFLIDTKPMKSNDTLNGGENTLLYNSQYKLTNFSIARVETIYECCTEPYVSVTYFIEFERRASFVTIFHSFACCIVLFNLIPMSLPPKRKEKLWLNCLSLLLVIGHLIYFTDKFSGFASDTPYIVIFHCGCLILITGSLLFAVFSIFILNTQFARNHLPVNIKKILQNPIAKLLKVDNVQEYVNQVPQGHSKFVNVRLDDESNLINSISNVQHWKVFVQLTERILLVIYIFIYLILGTTCFV